MKEDEWRKHIIDLLDYYVALPRSKKQRTRPMVYVPKDFLKDCRDLLLKDQDESHRPITEPGRDEADRDRRDDGT